MVQHSGLHSHGHCSSLPHARLCNTGDSGEKALRPVPPVSPGGRLAGGPAAVLLTYMKITFITYFFPSSLFPHFPEGQDGYLLCLSSSVRMHFSALCHFSRIYYVILSHHQMGVCTIASVTCTLLLCARTPT